jgi:hypothetical protein
MAAMPKNAKEFTDYAPIRALVGFRAWCNTNAMDLVCAGFGL